MSNYPEESADPNIVEVIERINSAIKQAPPLRLAIDDHQSAFNCGWNAAMNMVYTAGGPDFFKLVRRIEEEKS